MQIHSTSPLPVFPVLWQPAPAAWALTLVCKATYRLEPHVSPLAEMQEAINEADNHWDDDETRSLYAPTDVVPFKPRADVLLVGHAFAPGGQPVRSLDVEEQEDVVVTLAPPLNGSRPAMPFVESARGSRAGIGGVAVAVPRGRSEKTTSAAGSPAIKSTPGTWCRRSG
jgi:hypothetical protein